jgi:hypothetical protein
MRSLLILTLASAAFAGQSIVLTNHLVANNSVPAAPSSGQWIREGYLDVIPPSISTTNYLIHESTTGLLVWLLPGCGGICFQATVQTESGVSPASGCTIRVDQIPSHAVYFRYQHNYAAFSDSCELWDINGNLFSQQTSTYTSITANSAGANIVGGPDTEQWAFTRLCTGGTVAPGSTMPTTTGPSGNGCPAGTRVFEWKFDGSLADSSGNGYTAAMDSGSPSYATTLHQIAIAVIKTAGAPIWSNWVSFRAGNPGQLDGTASLSQSDASLAVTYFWQVLSGPSVPTWSSHTSATPVLTGLIFGDYLIQLTVTDASGQKATTSLDIGAVATDTNGVVVQANPNADIIFGPMIAWGKNPWGLQDANSKFMSDSQYTYQNCCARPTWVTSGQGTISYIFAGVGAPGTTGTSLTTAISATDTSITVNNASVLDLTVLPTRISIDGNEDIRICSISGTSGQQTLIACYDGRGQVGGGLYARAAQAHGVGAGVGQFKVTGTSTLFTSDPNTPICPAGAPGPTGRITYSTGTVTLAAGSSTATGTGTVWGTPNVQGGYILRVNATHSSTPFVFTAQINTITDATHLALSRAFPTDADSGSYSYAIVAYRYPSLNYTRADGSTGRTLQNGINGCESDTAMYGMAGHDYPAIDAVRFSGQNYSYKDFLGEISAFGPNFYGTGFAERAMWLRSGYGKAFQVANFVDNYWAPDPEVDGGYVGAEPLLAGGAAIGAFANIATNPSSLLTWGDLRGFIASGAAVITRGCDDDDSRDTGYLRAWSALGALFDTNPTYNPTWISNLRAIYNSHDFGGLACKQPDNSFANAFLVDTNPNSGPNTGFVTLNLTHGSTTATGAGITPDRCNVAASGTASVTSHSASIIDPAGNFINPTYSRLIIHGTKNGGVTTYIGVFAYHYNSSTSITLNGLWPGDTGSFTYVIENTGYPSTIGTSQADHAGLQIPWACTWNSATQVTLDRPWTGATGAGILFQSPGRPLGGYGIGGYGQQPYMLGITVTSMKLASSINDGSYGANWLNLAQNSASWLWNNTYDPYSQGIQYGVIYGGCDQKVPVSTSYGWVTGTGEGNQGGCQYDATPLGGKDSARGIAVEALSSFRVFYEANPTPIIRTFGDTVYGSIFANAAYTTGGVYSAPDNLPGSNQGPGSLSSYKWPGFYFGMGLSHQWPAVRLGGVLPAVNRRLDIGVCLGACPGAVQHATSVDVVATAPNSAVTTTNCSSSPCAIIADARQGNYVIALKYKSRGGKILAQSDPEIVVVK